MSRIVSAGIDPAKRKFTDCFYDEQGDPLLKPCDCPVAREGFRLFESRLDSLGLVEGDRLRVGVEATGSLDDNLLAFLHRLRERSPFSVSIHVLDPGQLKRFGGPRPSREKSDAADARNATEFTRIYADRLHQNVNDPESLILRRLVNERATHVQDRTRQMNRLGDRLVTGFPEFEKVVSGVASPLGLCVLRKVPTAAHAAARRPSSLARLQSGPHARPLGIERATRLVKLAKESVASATSEDDADAIRFLIDRIETLNQRIAYIDGRLKKWSDGPEKPAAQATALAATPVAPETNPAPKPADSDDAPVQPIPSRPSANAAPTPAPLPAAPTLPPTLAKPRCKRRRDPAAPQPSLARQTQLLRTYTGFGVVAASALVLRTGGPARYDTSNALAAQVGACCQRNQTGSSRNNTYLTHRGDRRIRPLLFLTIPVTIANDPAMAFHYWRMKQPRPGGRPGLRPFSAQWACIRRSLDIIWAMCQTQTSYDPEIPLRNAKRQHPDLWITFEQTEEGKKVLARYNAKKAKSAS